MVLINELTVEQINAALLHLQRSKDEVVGGNKGTTIQNISVNNSGGGNNVDYLGTIKLLARNIEANKDAIDKNTSDISSLKDDMKNIEKSVEETLQGLVDSGVSDLSFDSLTKQLTITTNAGDTFQTVITQDIGVLSYDSVNNKLVLTTGEQSQEITLPYILSSEKGSANGVATLDENGRVPYSQLPESAMEFLGQWNASTNTPHLADGTGTNGDFYIVSTGGTVNLGTTQNPHIITFSVNDRIVYEGDIAQWVRLPAGQVSSVNGQSGAVTLTASDIEYSTGVTIKDKIDANAVQSDWSVTDSSSLAYIKNKPSLATVATSGKYCDLSGKPTLGTAAECDASCFRASTWNPNMNDVSNATSVSVAQNAVCRKIIMTNQICNVGYITRVGIGLQRGTSGWGTALLSVGTNDEGTSFYDYKFSNTGVLTAACFCGTASNSNNFNGCSYAQACCDILMGAECCFAGNINIPKDAVLHYSFDEVPDYPDGSADVSYLNNNTYDIQSGNYKFYNNGGAVFSNVNGNLQIAITGGASNGAFLSYTYVQNKILKIKLKITSIQGTLQVHNGYGNIIKNYTEVGVYEFSVICSNTVTYPSFYLIVPATSSSCTFTVEQIYIGDGSYSTPIIDNANGQNNATNNGGIAVEGVSGKAIKTYNYKYVDMGDYYLSDNFTVSIWVNPENNSSGVDGEILRRWSHFILRNGATLGNSLQVYIYFKDGTNQYFSVSNPLPPNVWTNLTVIKNNNKLYVYTNGQKLQEYTLNGTELARSSISNLTLSSADNTRPQSYDDLLIFDRALSEQEVQALYLNKANTPKYYDINNYDIKNADTTPTQNSNALITSGAVYNATQGKVSMADVSNGVVPVALCSGSSSVGKSGCCSLTFNTSTGELDGRFFSGVAQYVGQSLGNSNTRYDIALLNHSPIGTGWFNEIAYACCRTLRYNPVTCTLYACNICGNVLTPNTWITVYSSEYAEIKEMGVSGLYCFEAICNCIMGQYLYSALECAMYYAYGRTFLPSIDTSLYFPVLGRYESVDRDNKNMGEIINEISASNNTISYGVTGGWYESVSSSQTSCVNTRCFQFMFSGQHIS